MVTAAESRVFHYPSELPLVRVPQKLDVPINGFPCEQGLQTFIDLVFEGFTSQELGQKAWLVNGQTCSVFLGARDNSDTAKYTRRRYFLSPQFGCLNTPNKKKTEP